MKRNQEAYYFFLCSKNKLTTHKVIEIKYSLIQLLRLHLIKSLGFIVQYFRKMAITMKTLKRQ